MSLKRSLYLDQIKAVVVALVIAIHAPMAFSVGWFGVQIPVEQSVGPLFKDFCLVLTCDQFLHYANDVFDFRLFCTSLSAQERGCEVPERPSHTAGYSILGWLAIN